MMMARDGVETKLYQLHVRDPQLGLIKNEQPFFVDVVKNYLRLLDTPLCLCC